MRVIVSVDADISGSQGFRPFTAILCVTGCPGLRRGGRGRGHLRRGRCDVTFFQ